MINKITEIIGIEFIKINDLVSPLKKYASKIVIPIQNDKSINISNIAIINS